MKGVAGTLPRLTIIGLAAGSLAGVGGAGRLDPDPSADSAGNVPERRLVEDAARLVHGVAERVWPGWSVPFELLLVEEGRERLYSQRRPEGFVSIAALDGIGMVLERPPVFSPGMEATMPIFGPPATIVVGTPESTGRTIPSWLAMVLHEHFHRWQMRDGAYFEAVDALDLAGGDTTGMWMLDYAFPYAESEVASAFDRLARELAAALRRPADDDLAAAAAGIWDRYAELLAALPPPDQRYLRLQLWQEGVARWVELRVAEAAAARFAVAAELESTEPFAVVACSLREQLFAELEEADLAARGRLSFYALGAGLAMLLDRTEPDWQERYEAPRFQLAPAPRDRRAEN